MEAVLAPARLGLKDLVAVGSVGLRSRRLRAALSALGVAIGIASMVAVLGLSESGRASLLSVLDRLGTNLMTVQAGQSIFGEASTLPDDAEEMMARVGAVQLASGVTDVQEAVYRNELIPEAETSGISVRAVDTNLLETIGGTLREGRFLDEATARYPAVVLGSVAARRLGVDGLSGRVRVRIGGQWFTVIGILDDLALHPDLERAALIGRPVAVDRLGANTSASLVYVRADPEDADAVEGLLARTANPQHPEEVTIARPSDALEARAAAKTAFTGLFFALGGVALLVGGVGIANVMVISVLERRSEIGLRRALGATRGQIRTQFLAESLLLAALGGAAGVIFGAVATAGIASAQGWPAVVPPAAVAVGLGAALLTGAVAGLYPAMRASRLAPTEALRAQ